MRSRFARLVALCVALLVVGESAGIARALGAGSMVDCCCGSHAIARACKCLHCPTRLHHAPTHEVARVTSPERCLSMGHDGILVVTAVLAATPRITASLTHSLLPLSQPRSLDGISLDPARPPP